MSDSDVCQTCGMATPPDANHNGWACLLAMERPEEISGSAATVRVAGFRLFGRRIRFGLFGNQRTHRTSP